MRSIAIILLLLFSSPCYADTNDLGHQTEMVQLLANELDVSLLTVVMLLDSDVEPFLQTLLMFHAASDDYAIETPEARLYQTYIRGIHVLRIGYEIDQLIQIPQRDLDSNLSAARSEQLQEDWIAMKHKYNSFNLFLGDLAIAFGGSYSKELQMLSNEASSRLYWAGFDIATWNGWNH